MAACPHPEPRAAASASWPSSTATPWTRRTGCAPTPSSRGRRCAVRRARPRHRRRKGPRRGRLGPAPGQCRAAGVAPQQPRRRPARDDPGPHGLPRDGQRPHGTDAADLHRALHRGGDRPPPAHPAHRRRRARRDGVRRVGHRRPPGARTAADLRLDHRRAVLRCGRAVLPPVRRLHGGARGTGRAHQGGGGPAQSHRGAAADRTRPARPPGPQHHRHRGADLRGLAHPDRRPGAPGPRSRRTGPRRHRRDLPGGPRRTAHHPPGPARGLPRERRAAARPGRPARPRTGCRGGGSDGGALRTGPGGGDRPGDRRRHVPDRAGIPDERRAARGAGGTDHGRRGTGSRRSRPAGHGHRRRRGAGKLRHGRLRARIRHRGDAGTRTQFGRHTGRGTPSRGRLRSRGGAAAARAPGRLAVRTPRPGACGRRRRHHRHRETAR